MLTMLVGKAGLNPPCSCLPGKHSCDERVFDCEHHHYGNWYSDNTIAIARALPTCTWMLVL